MRRAVVRMIGGGRVAPAATFLTALGFALAGGLSACAPGAGDGGGVASSPAAASTGSTGGGQTSTSTTTTATTTTNPVPNVFSVRVQTPAWVESGHVELAYTLVDPQAAAVAIGVDYSLDQGQTWKPASEGIGSDGTSGLSSGPAPGSEHLFIWDSFRDLGQSYHHAVQLRVAISSASGVETGMTQPFTLNNAWVAGPTELVRGPYLQDVRSDSAIVVWRTRTATVGEVQWGSTTALGNSVPSTGAAGRDHAVTITGLQPGLRYHDQILANGQTIAPAASFRTSPLAGSSRFSFVVLGDSGKGSQAQWDIAQGLERAGGDFALHTGDIVYTFGEDANYEPRFFSPYRKLLARTPMYAVLGNHDGAAFFGQPFVQNFHVPQGSGSDKYYSFTYGDAEVFCLDTGSRIFPYMTIYPGSKQLDWFTQALSSSQALWKIVVFHHPPYSTGLHGPSLELKYVRQLLSPTIEQYGVDLVLNGHDHNYERTTPRHDFASGGRGPVYVVVGSSGATRGFSGSPASWTAFRASEHAFLRVNIDGRTLHADALRADGSVLDAFDLTK